MEGKPKSISSQFYRSLDYDKQSVTKFHEDDSFISFQFI